MKIIILTTLMLAIACQNNVPQKESLSQTFPQIANLKQKDSLQNQTQIDEFESETFSSELKRGKRNLGRVEISTYKKDEKLFVKTNFYAKSKSRWIQKNEFDLEKFGGLPIQPEVNDFNGDGFNDVTYISDSSARGANEIRALFIYNAAKDEFVYVKNSGDFPNLGYNPLLKGLTSWRFTGSTTTEFLELKGNKLVIVASVEDRGTERTINIIDKAGKEKLLRREKRNNDGFERYVNFDPVQ
jgi:hypothetical protein